MIAEENNTTLEESLQRASKPLARKIEYSVNLIRKAEKIALSYDNRGGISSLSVAARTAKPCIISPSWQVSSSRLR